MEMHFWSIFGRLLGGAGGRGEACGSLQILQAGAPDFITPCSPFGGAANLKASPLPPAPGSGWLLAGVLAAGWLLAGWLAGCWLLAGWLDPQGSQT